MSVLSFLIGAAVKGKICSLYILSFKISPFLDVVSSTLKHTLPFKSLLLTIRIIAHGVNEFETVFRGLKFWRCLFYRQ